MNTGLKDKVVVVTGASGGIGRAIAALLAEEGASLVLQGRTQHEQLEQWVRARGLQDRTLCVRFDVGDRDATFAAFERARERFGRLDLCVANAGVWPTEDVPFHAMSEQRLRSTIETNLLGAAWTAQAFLAQLEITGPRADGHGASLVFIGSTAGRFGERDHCDYSITKAGLAGMVRTLKNEVPRLDPFGRVNLVQPGWTVTPMARAATRDDTSLTRVVQTMALRQLARPEDIARTVLFLLSPLLARHVSGEEITVAGGMEGRLLWPADQVDTRTVRARLEADA